MKDQELTYVVPTIGQDGMTALHYAAYCNDAQAVRAELQAGAPVDVRDNNGWTPKDGHQNKSLNNAILKKMRLFRS